MKQRLTTTRNVRYINVRRRRLNVMKRTKRYTDWGCLNIQPTPMGILATQLYIKAKQLGYGVY